MSVNMNRVILAGNLTRDPAEIRYVSSSQTAVINLGLAVSREYTTKEGEKKKDVAFIGIVVWGKQAEACKEYLKKGSPILVEGRLQSRSWETAEKEKRNTLEVTAERVQFLPRRLEEQKQNEEEPVKEEEAEEVDHPF